MRPWRVAVGVLLNSEAITEAIRRPRRLVLRDDWAGFVSVLIHALHTG